MSFKIGDTVWLLEDNQYGASQHNPALNSKWSCEGTITRGSNNYWEIQWSNGCLNSGYCNEDLTKNNKLATIFDWPTAKK